MKYVNAHTHRVQESGVTAVMNLHKDAAEVPENGFYSAGIHPWFISEGQQLEEDFSRLQNMLTAKNVVAVGECGLDRLARTPFPIQTEVFERQLLLASEFKKPVIIHNVRSGSELLQIRKNTPAGNPWLLHGYHGSIREAELFLQHGCLFGFGKHLFNPRSNAVASCRFLPGENILPETDDAEITVKEVIEMIATIKNIDFQKLNEQLHKNFVSFFNQIKNTT